MVQLGFDLYSCIGARVYSHYVTPIQQLGLGLEHYIRVWTMEDMKQCAAAIRG